MRSHLSLGSHSYKPTLGSTLQAFLRTPRLLNPLLQASDPASAVLSRDKLGPTAEAQCVTRLIHNTPSKIQKH